MAANGNASFQVLNADGTINAARLEALSKAFEIDESEMERQFAELDDLSDDEDPDGQGASEAPHITAAMLQSRLGAYQTATREILNAIKAQPEKKEQLFPMAKDMRAAAKQIEALLASPDPIAPSAVPGPPPVWQKDTAPPARQTEQVQRSAPPADLISFEDTAAQPVTSAASAKAHATAQPEPHQNALLDDTAALLSKNAALLAAFDDDVDDDEYNEDSDEQASQDDGHHGNPAGGNEDVDDDDDDIDLGELEGLDSEDDEELIDTGRDAAPQGGTSSQFAAALDDAAASGRAAMHQSQTTSSSRSLQSASSSDSERASPMAKKTASGGRLQPRSSVPVARAEPATSLPQSHAHILAEVNARRAAWEEAARAFLLINQEKSAKECLQMTMQLERVIATLEAGQLTPAMGALMAKPIPAVKAAQSNPHEEVFQRLFSAFDNQIQEASDLATLYHNVGELPSEQKLEIFIQRMKQERDLLAKAHQQGQAPPPTLQKEFTFHVPETNFDVQPDHMHLHIKRLIGLVPPRGVAEKDLVVYVKAAMDFPESGQPQVVYTSKASGSVSPEFSESKPLKLDIVPGKQLFRYLKRGALVVEAYHSKGLLSIFSKDSELARCKIPLQDLQQKATLHTCVEMKTAARGHSCRVEVEIRLRMPAAGATKTSRVFSWVRFDTGKTASAVDQRLTQIEEHNKQTAQRQAARAHKAVLPGINEIYCLSVLKLIVDRIGDSLKQFDLKPGHIPEAARRPLLLRKQASQRYKQLHATCFRDGTTRQQYIQRIKAEARVYHELIASESNVAAEAQARLQVLQAELAKLTPDTAPAAPRSVASRMEGPTQGSQASQDGAGLAWATDGHPPLGDIHSYKVLTDLFTELDGQLAPYQAALTSMQATTLPPEVQALSKKRIATLKRMKEVEAHIASATDPITAMRGYAEQLKRDVRDYIPRAQALLKSETHKASGQRLVSYIKLMKAEVEEIEQGLPEAEAAM